MNPERANVYSTMRSTTEADEQPHSYSFTPVEHKVRRAVKGATNFRYSSSIGRLISPDKKQIQEYQEEYVNSFKPKITNHLTVNKPQLEEKTLKTTLTKCPSANQFVAGLRTPRTTVEKSSYYGNQKSSMRSSMLSGRKNETSKDSPFFR